MQDAINKIQNYTKEINLNQLKKHPLVLDGCLMQLIHIGETANKISKKVPKFCDLPLAEMAKLRNFAAHDYLWVNIWIVIKVIETNLPEINSQIEKLLKKK